MATVSLGHVRDDDAFLVHRALADEALAHLEAIRVGRMRRARVACQHAQVHGAVVAHLVDHALVRVDERRQLGQQHAADGGEIALALQHAGDAREVRLEPVLLGVAVGRQPQVVDHRVDVVFEVRHFAAGVDLNRPREVALGYGGGDFRDRAHLRGEVRGEEVHVTGQVLPGARGARHVRLPAEAAFDTHFARDGGHLIGEDREGLRHVVDGVGKRRDPRPWTAL